MHKKALLFAAVTFLVAGIPAATFAQNTPPVKASEENKPTAPKPLVNFFSRLQAGNKVKVVAYGTSLTRYGYWATAMTEWFQAKYPGQVTVVNSGGPGQTSEWGLKSLKAKVLDEKPDLVTVEFGYNDAHQRFKISPETSKSNLDQIVSAIRGENPNAAIILQTMNAPWDKTGGFAAATDRPNLVAYNEGYRAYAREHGLALGDNYPLFAQALKDDPEKYHAMVPDGSHPDKNASLSITWPTLRTILEAAQAAAGTPIKG